MSNYPAGMIFGNEDADEAMLQAECLKFARRLGRMTALAEKKYKTWGRATKGKWDYALHELTLQCSTLGFLSFDAELGGYVITPDCKESYEAGYLSVYQKDRDTEFDWGWD